MRISATCIALAAALAVLAGAGAARAQDGMAVVKHRQDTMKRMGEDLKTIHQYGQGKADQEKAVAAAADITTTLPKVPELFPKGTGTAEFPGKSGAKPAIWTEWDKFLGDEKNTAAKADGLLAQIKAGDKAAALSGPGKLWNNGCQGCHKSYRQKI